MASKQQSSGGGYDCSFVDPLPKDVQSNCSICLQVLREPYLVGCCGYRFCRTCIGPVQGQGKRCPLCNGKLASLPDKQLQRILSDKMVYCTNKGNGCTWKGKLANLESHFAQACTFNLVQCSYCKKYKDTASKVKYHYCTCPMYPVLCPHGCGSKFVRKKLQDHVDKNCPMVIVDCVFKFAGCNVVLRRREMKKHENPTEHLVQAAVRISELEAENTNLKEELRAVKEQKQGSAVSFKKEAGTIQHFRVTEIPAGTNKRMLVGLFGQYGLVKDIEMDVYGENSAKVTYKGQDSIPLCFCHGKEKRIKFKSTQVCVTPQY